MSRFIPNLHVAERLTCSAAILAANAAPWRACALQASGPAGQRWPPRRDARATNGSEDLSLDEA
ncbi:MAG TPA: hypothetical protein VH599_14505 [Ktedonobacterales bacterium]